MPEDARILELLEVALDSGRPPEDVCAECPELVPELRRRLERCQIVQGELAALFPTETVATEGDEWQADDSFSVLPAIPGYELHSILGRGGMGVVYKARHLALKRLVAIKMILSGAHASASERSRLKREAEALAKLTHPHIVQIYDVGELEGRPFFTMEFVEGGNLAEELGGAPQPANHCAGMLIKLASAVEAAHRCGVIHRDLKPANVLLAPDVPKVSDFGLSRQVDDADLITLPGSRMGTPSYMAPEQASKHWGEVGRAADIYALGAILYEMMTGRPPFRGESAVDTQRQLLNEDVVLPSRLNARVPRDLETICLKCLQKDQGRRYASAAALADDLARFQKGEPITARRVRPLERGSKWVRRHPATATAVGSAAALALVLATGGTWIISQRSAARNAVETDLARAVQFQKDSKWPEASATLDRANMHLSEFGPADLRRRYDIVRRDSDLVANLGRPNDWAKLDKVDNIDSGYIDALHRAQIGGPEDPPEVVAARIRDSNVRPAVIDALDYWLSFSHHLDVHGPWVREVLRLADHDPTGWRDHVRDPAVWENADALAKAAATAPVADQPSAFLFSMANQWAHASNSDPLVLPFLKRVQEAHPDDFWINLTIGNELDKLPNRAEAMRYLQAAEAIHPEASIVRNELGRALLDSGRLEDALTEFRESLRYDPDSAMGQENYAGVLAMAGHDAEAVPRLEAVIRRDPTNPRIPIIYSRIGQSLVRLGRDQEAVEAFRKSINLLPNPEAMPALQRLFIREGRWDEVESTWQDAIKVNPAAHDNWDGYAEYCLFLGHTDEYRKIRGQLLDRFGQDKDPSTCDRAGRACLLLGDDSQAIAIAAAMTDRAVHANGPNAAALRAYFMVGKGLADYRQGKFDAAVSSVEGIGATVLRPMPQLIAAMAHYRLGQQQIARKLLADSVLAYDWSRQNATTHEAWIYHVLRREAEQLILPNFNALLDGSAQPRDNDERWALFGVCAFEDMRGRRAQLWIDALQADPKLEDTRTEDAAAALASAGAGQGSDAAKFTDDDRARWRQSAMALLSKRIDFLESILNSSNPQKDVVRNDLLTLQRSPDLAGLRDPAALARLPESERTSSAALWARVGAALDRSNQAK